MPNKYGIELHEFVVMSNHYHLVFTDPHGNRPEFFKTRTEGRFGGGSARP